MALVLLDAGVTRRVRVRMGRLLNWSSEKVS
jgi:hypothetical protein